MLRSRSVIFSSWIALSSVLAVVAACSSDGDGSPAASSDAGAASETGATGTDSSAGTDSAPSGAIVVTSAGGTFSSGGVTLVVPPGAVSADTAVTLSLIDAVPPGTGLEGAELLTRVLLAKPHGTQFLAPVTVSMPLTKTPSGAAEVRYLADDADTTWERLGDATVSCSTLSFKTSHFSDMVGVSPGSTDASVSDGSATDAAQGDGSVTDAAVTDAAATDAGLETAECFTTDLAASAGVTIHRAGNRLYWGQTTGAGANTVHSVKTDLTDHQSYPAQYGVVGFASNANGVFWMTNGAPVDSGVTTGLMKLTTSGGTPTFVDALLGIPLLMTGDDAHLFLSTQSGFTYYLSRTDGQGQNTGSFSGGLYDQLLDVGGYVYRLTTTNHATPAWCGTAGHTMPFIERLAVGGTAPVTAELVVDGCAVQAITGRADEFFIRFDTDGTNVYAQSNVGELWRTPVGGGTPTRMFQPYAPLPNQGSAVAIVGSNLVFVDQDTSVGAQIGTKKIPLAGGTATRFAPASASMSWAADASYIYWAKQGSVCRLHVP